MAKKPVKRVKVEMDELIIWLELLGSWLRNESMNAMAYSFDGRTGRAIDMCMIPKVTIESRNRDMEKAIGLAKKIRGKVRWEK